MLVLVLRKIAALRLTIAIVTLAAAAPLAKADPSEPVRIIAITKENAERSAAAMSAAKSPFIGMPPPGKVIRAEPDWRKARAEFSANETDAARQGDKADHVHAEASLDESNSDHAGDRARVQIITHGKAGPTVGVYFVPRHNSVRGM